MLPCYCNAFRKIFESHTLSFIPSAVPNSIGLMKTTATNPQQPTSNCWGPDIMRKHVTAPDLATKNRLAVSSTCSNHTDVPVRASNKSFMDAFRKLTPSKADIIMSIKPEHIFNFAKGVKNHEYRKFLILQ